jgi:MtN3 and saliva related transmembrane protein
MLSVEQAAASSLIRSMSDLLPSIVGTAAAALTTLSYLPQVRKAWPRGQTSDQSLKMLIALTTGLLLWIVYGIMQGDWVVAGSNSIGATLVGLVLALKIRDISSKRS